ncbi:MAG: DUF1934 domain-containing protein [Clostridiales bacterium]|nr:DUF1934 domain-containing protein [Clostridiales bacterium]
MKKEVKIHLNSRIFDLQASDQLEKYIEAHPAYEAEEVSTAFEMSCRGVLTAEDGRISVRYKEPETEGMGDTTTTLFFECSEPQTVNLCRTGAVKSDLVFNVDSGRKTCVYQTEVAPFMLSIVTKKLVNTLSAEGGALHLDYKIEINNMNVERTILDLTVKVL